MVLFLLHRKIYIYQKRLMSLRLLCHGQNSNWVWISVLCTTPCCFTQQRISCLQKQYGKVTQSWKINSRYCLASNYDTNLKNYDCLIIKINKLWIFEIQVFSSINFFLHTVLTRPTFSICCIFIFIQLIIFSLYFFFDQWNFRVFNL